MKHTFQTTISLLLCLVMLSTSMLTGCDGGESKAGGTSTAQNTTQSNNQSNNKTDDKENTPNADNGGSENTPPNNDNGGNDQHNYSVGLAYESRNDGTCTIKGIGTCTDTALYIPEYIEGYKVTRIGEEAFSGCAGLTSIIIPDSVTRIDSFAFSGCTGLTNITIPDSVTRIGSYAFSDCTGLTSITIPFVGESKSGTVNTKFGYIFGASQVTQNYDYVPASLKTVVITGGSHIGSDAFYRCTGLTSITIPNSVTSIGSYAFSWCKGLTSITIPNSVTSIGNYAFSSCTGLTSINYDGSVSQWNAISKGADWDSDTVNYTIYCTDGVDQSRKLYAQYQEALEVLRLQYYSNVIELETKISDSQAKINAAQTAINNAYSQLAALSTTCPQWFLQQYINNWQAYGSTGAATVAAQNAWAQEYNNKKNQLNNTISMNSMAISTHQTNITLYNNQIEVLTDQYNANENALKLQYGIS